MSDEYRKKAVMLTLVNYITRMFLERLMDTDTPPKEVLTIPELPLSESELTQEDMKPLFLFFQEWGINLRCEMSEFVVTRVPRVTLPDFPKPAPEAPVAAPAEPPEETDQESETADADQDPDAKKPKRKQRKPAEG